MIGFPLLPSFSYFSWPALSLQHSVGQSNGLLQSEGESVEQYMTALYHHIETCEYGDLKDEMLCGRLVVGICDSVTLQKLQMDPEPTLVPLVEPCSFKNQVFPNLEKTY